MGRHAIVWLAHLYLRLVQVEVRIETTLLMHVVHLVRLKPPRKAAEQMDLLTVPSRDSADLMVRLYRQVEEALYQPPLSPLATATGPSRYLEGRLEPARQRWIPMASCRTRNRSRPESSARHLRKR